MRIKYFLFILPLLWISACAGVKPMPTSEGPGNLSENQRINFNAKVLFFLTNGYMALQEGNARQAFAYFDQIEAQGVVIPEILMLKALILIQGGEIDQATREIDRGLKLAPDNIELLLLKGGILTAQRQNADAINIYQQILKLDPANEMAAVFLAGLYEEEKSEKKACALLEKFVRQNPDADRAWYELGRLYLGDKENDKAKKAFQTAVENDPENLKAWIGLGFAHEELHENQQAIEAYQAALKLNPSDRVLRQQLIRLHLRANDPSAALEETQKMEILGGGTAETQTTRGIILYHQGQTVPALAEFKLVLEKDPNNYQARYLASACLARLNKLEEAMAGYQKIPRDSLYYLDARINYAYLLSRVGRAGDSLVELDLLARDFPDEIEVLRAKSSVLTEMGHTTEAEETLGKARKIKPDDEDLMYSLAILYEKTGRWKLAVEIMDQRLQKNPDDLDALNFIGYTLSDHDAELERAEKLLKRAVELRPGSGHIVDSYGWALFHLKQYDQALEYLMRALELEPSEAVIAEHIGDVYSAKGQKAKAVEYWKKARQLNPDPDTAKRLKEKLGE